MSRTRYLLVLARLEAERRRKLNVIASASQLELVTVEDVTAALSWLERHEPEVVAFDSSTPKAEQLCQKLRSRKAWGRIPMIALADEPTDAHVEKLYAMGVDDVVPLAAWPAFVARVRGLPRGESIRPPPDRGKAIVADPERERCDVVGRVLTNAGFDVRYALDRRALEYYSLQGDVGLIVVNVELGDPRQYVEQARKNGSTAAWVIASRRRDLEENARALAGLERVASVPALGAPESVLFVANELLSNRRTARRTARVLHGTLVAFRPAGTDADDLGFSYNVSENGLYVRTLAAPEGEEVWLELCPPRQTRRVRLLGRVVWRRGFEGSTGASVPPGFGVELVDGLGEALATWRECYHALDGAAVAPRSRPPPKPPSLPPPHPAKRAPSSRPPKPAAEAEPQMTAMAPRMASQPDIPRDSGLPVIEMGAPVSMPENMLRASTPGIAPAEPAPARPGGAGKLLALLFVLVVVGGAAIFFLWKSGILGGATRPTATASTGTAVPSGAAATPSAPAAPPPSASVSAPPKPTADLSALGPTEGYLFVQSSLDAKVFINGRAIGPTNQPNKTGCGMRFVRVGEDGGHWLTDGHSVKIECGKLTQTEFKPGPHAP